MQQAADYLGVSPNTLRNWGRTGKLEERRHPVNNYGQYAISDLESLLSEVERPTKKRRAKPR
ncbi:MAG: MerR family transcriptional regulator [Pirellulales bacterium]